MSFDVGDKVVYPHHGAAVIERRETRQSPSGEPRDYLVLRLAYGDLTLMVPADNTDSVGLREPTAADPYPPEMPMVPDMRPEVVPESESA